MPKESTPQQHPTAVVTTKTPWRLKHVIVNKHFVLDVTFNDNLTGKVDMSHIINDPNAGVFAALRDPLFFEKVFIALGVATWPNGADLAPDTMYEHIKKSGLWRP